MNRETLVIIFFFMLLFFVQLFFIVGYLNKKKRIKEVTEDIKKSKNIFIDNYQDEFVSKSDLVRRMRTNKLIMALGKPGGENTSKWQKLFNNAKNPWGLTPTLFRAIRLGSIIIGLLISLLFYILMEGKQFVILGLIISGIGWWYPMYYYKEIAKERENEWDKMYEFIWVIKHSAWLYDAKKVCLETKKYIENHYPQYKELISGFNDFYNHWDERSNELPEFILKYYNFPVPKEIYNILFQMQQTGNPPDQSLDNLRVFTLNRHKAKIQKCLSLVASKATIASLPFLMISIIIALLIPMILTVMQFM